MCIAAAGYAVMAIFAFGYGLAWLIGMPIAHAVIAGSSGGRAGNHCRDRRAGNRYQGLRLRTQLD
jgi:hypothetical protein